MVKRQVFSREKLAVLLQQTLNNIKSHATLFYLRVKWHLTFLLHPPIIRRIFCFIFAGNRWPFHELIFLPKEDAFWEEKTDRRVEKNIMTFCAIISIYIGICSKNWIVFGLQSVYYEQYEYFIEQSLGFWLWHEFFCCGAAVHMCPWPLFLPLAGTMWELSDTHLLLIWTNIFLMYLL